VFLRFCLFFFDVNENTHTFGERDFFFLELRTEPRALCLLGKQSTTELNPPTPKGIFNM